MTAFPSQVQPSRQHSAVDEPVQIAQQTFTLRDLRTDHRSALLQLHREVFGGHADSRWFEWKYVQGGGQGVGLWLRDRMVAFCGGTPRSVCHKGRWLRDLQIGDVMVLPEWRGVLTRRGPFFHVCESFYRSRLGSQQDFDVAWGFPNLRHLQLAVKMGLSWDAGVMHELVWSTKGVELPWNVQARPWVAADAAQFDRSIGAFWAAMHQSATASDVALGRRDSDHARWRYLQRPDRRYRWLRVGRAWSLRPMGVAVLAESTADGALSWLDWIGPMDALPLASLACRVHAARQGASYLTAWASDAVCAQLSVTEPARTAVASGLGVPVASDVTENSVSSLNWWFMGGDTDFL